jgi:uncharacterized protein
VFFGLQELELRKIHFDVEIPPGEIEFTDETLRQATPLKAAGVAELISRAVGEIRIKGHVAIELEALCDRCLEPARIPVESDFDLFYRPEESAASEEHEIDAGEAEIAFYEGGGIELEDVLREYVLLALPMQVICREGCKGICPVCGADRNLADCGCQLKAVDDRWAALRKLS